MVEEIKFYKTSNTEESSFLIARKHFLLKAGGIEGRFTFIFEDTPALRENLLDFSSGLGLISVRALFSAYDRCRDLLWNWKREKNV